MGFWAQRMTPSIGWALLVAAIVLSHAFLVEAREVSIVAGACLFEVEERNAGIVDELGPVCGATFDQIRQQLGVPPPSHPILVRVVRRFEDLRTAVPESMDVPQWAGAYAIPSIPLVVVALRHSSGAPTLELGVSLAHELSHVAMHQKLGGKPVPRWFSEGVAIQQSEAFPIERYLVLLSALRAGRLMPLSHLERYPVHAGHVNLAYAQAADFVGFLLRREGFMGIRHAIRRYAGGDTFAQAMATAFHADIPVLERQWIKGLPTTATWIQLLTGDGLLWGFASLLLVLAYLGARKRHRLAMARLAAEDELSDIMLLAQGKETDDSRH
ncbi:MAG: hypothetical protein MUC50_23855 [Myxococcota bacterium]|jgi:hypothetical protein|nr:hypothetical protein [Myxococcota bacterium]